MQRILFRHHSGSKANQTEEFPAGTTPEIVIGREEGVQLKYDPTRDKDDLVSRRHAKISRDPQNREAYIIEDMGSRNGTFVNNQRLSGSASLSPGDRVQLGPGGPEFEFDLDPRPQIPARTREATVADLAAAAPATRESNAFTPSSSTSPPPATGSATGTSKPTVGKATVERMIGDTKKQGQKTTLFVGLGAAGLVALVGGLLLMNSNKSEQAVRSALNDTTNKVVETQAQLEEAKREAEAERLKNEEAAKNAPMTPAEIVKKNANAVARIEVVWKLTHERAQVYQEFMSNRDPQTGKPLLPIDRPELALYIELPDGSIEPRLTKTQNDHPIGGAHTGSGFVISNNGFMLTNRHVAATWETAYHFPDYASPGIVKRANGKYELLEKAPTNWVPAETKQAGQKLLGGFVGENVYIGVTFPGSQTPTEATSVRPSQRHDVAMLKIDSPGNIDKVEINDNYDEIRPGDTQIVMGYPAISPPVYGVVRSKDVFNQSAKLTEIPDPTVSVGNVGRILRGDEDFSKGKDPTFSMFGDAYQLTINSTGGGNSGGPVFDDKGRVTGIFFAGSQSVGPNITFAVPIRYGMELMSVSGRVRDSNANSSGDNTATNAASE